MTLSESAPTTDGVTVEESPARKKLRLAGRVLVPVMMLTIVVAGFLTVRSFLGPESVAEIEDPFAEFDEEFEASTADIDFGEPAPLTNDRADSLPVSHASSEFAAGAAALELPDSFPALPVPMDAAFSTHNAVALRQIPADQTQAPVFASASPGFPATPAAMSVDHFAAPPSNPPVWFEGTIEPIEDSDGGVAIELPQNSFPELPLP